jgi:hypothetical protein
MVTTLRVWFGSWSRDNALEGVPARLDRADASQDPRFEDIFPISIVRQAWCGSSQIAQLGELGRIRPPSPRSAA